jgi:hypothetical protein
MPMVAQKKMATVLGVAVKPGGWITQGEGRQPGRVGQQFYDPRVCAREPDDVRVRGGKTGV